MKSAIVTGASGNLGKSVVELLLKEGFIVSGTGQLSPGITGYEGVKIDLSDERAAGIWVQDISINIIQLTLLSLQSVDFRWGIFPPPQPQRSLNR